MNNRTIKLMFVIVLFFTQFVFVHAQQNGDNTPSDLVYVCINPIANDASDAYLVTLRGTSLVGVVILEQANVTIYGSPQMYLSVGVYTTTTNADTGGYKRKNKVATAYARPDTPGVKACLNKYPEQMASNLTSTIPLPVSPYQAVVIQTNGENLLEADFLGVFAFHFADTKINKNIQVIQMDFPEAISQIEISFPFITSSARFVLVSNREFTLYASSIEDTQTFDIKDEANILRGLLQELENSDPPINLAQIIDTPPTRIYPARGVTEDYVPETFLRLTATPGEIAPRFTPYKHLYVQAIEGFDAKYYLTTKFRLNAMNGADGTLKNQEVKAKIVEVDANGQLVIETHLGKAIVEAWLVEVVP